MERDMNQFASLHSMAESKLAKAQDRMSRLENLIIMLEAELARTEEKLAQCMKVLSDLRVSPHHPTMID
jgi:hypothetical protein